VFFAAADVGSRQTSDTFGDFQALDAAHVDASTATGALTRVHYG